MLAVLDFWDYFWIIWIVLVFSGWATAYSYARPSHLRRLRRLEAKIDLILKHLNLEYIGPLSATELSPEVKALANNPGKKIQAIKLHRELTGTSLKEAKEVVESYMAENRS